MVGLLGAVVAVLVTHLTRAVGWPVDLRGRSSASSSFFLLGGPLCLRSLGDTASLPGSGTLARLADQALFGWKDLLTTLPPVDGDGPLLVLPWLLGLVAGLVGSTLAHLPVRRAWLAALLPVAGIPLCCSGVILLGVRHPESLVVQGAVFAALALAWLAIRARRASAAVHGGTTSYVRGVGAVVMLGLAALLAHPASALFVGDDSERAVARNWVEPPFDIGRYPSPLAGFRKYVDLQGRARTRPTSTTRRCSTSTGCPPGSRVRFAAMDRYDGMVWGATDDALPGAGRRLLPARVVHHRQPRRGQARSTRPSPSARAGAGCGCPPSAPSGRMDFQTGDARAKAEVVPLQPRHLHRCRPHRDAARRQLLLHGRASPTTSSAEVTVGSRRPDAPAGRRGFIQGPTEKWTEDAGTDPMDRVLAVAEHLRSEGKYSDGVGRTERIYSPATARGGCPTSSSTRRRSWATTSSTPRRWRCSPTRSVCPPASCSARWSRRAGVVTGKDVSAWVELRAADGSWRTLPTEAFMSDTPPADQVPETNTPMSGTVIPPPDPIPPPSDAGEQSDADLKERKATRKKEADEDEDSIVPGLPVVGRRRW